MLVMGDISVMQDVTETNKEPYALAARLRDAS
jgi:hypothetical protein